MRVALCLYGLYNNKSDVNSGNNGYKYIQDKIYSKVDKHNSNIDTFFHSWDVGLEDKLVKQYIPIRYQFEKPHNFSEISIQMGVNEIEINKNFNRKGSIYKQCTINSSLSFLYSRSNSIEKAIKFSNEKEFKYDVIIAARFDLGQRSGWHKNYNVSLMELDLSLDMNYIYSAMWKQLNAGLADQWFFSNQENMKKLSKMYDMALKDYFQLESKYEFAITNGWVDSNVNDQFSNEVLKNNKDVDIELVKYPKWQMINNHILHKWHLINTDIYEKSRYIGNVRV